MLFLLTSAIINSAETLPIQNKQPLSKVISIPILKGEIRNLRTWKPSDEIRPTRESIEYSKNIQIKADIVDYTQTNRVLYRNTQRDSWFLILKWDSKTDTFIIEGHFDFDNNKIGYNLGAKQYIRINNEHNFNINISKNSNKKFSFKIVSKELSNKIIFSNIKSLSLHIEFFNIGFPWFNVPKKKNINIYLAFPPNVNHEKKDIQIQEINKKQEFFIQNGIRFSNSISNPIKLYKKIVIHPLGLKSGQHNKKMLMIENHEGTPFDRVNIKPKSIDNIPFTKNTNNKIIDLNTDHYGNVIYDRNTFYDLNKKETIVGFGPNSNPGYVIPYDYSGTFFPVFTFDANEYKDIKISWPLKISKPFFDKKNSIVNIDFKHSNDNVDHLVNELKWLNVKHNFFDLIENKELTYNKLLENLKKDKLEK